MIKREILKEIAIEQNYATLKLKIKNEVKREKLTEIKKLLKLPHAVIISGIRRSGKSTLLRQVRRDFYSEDGYYFNFEDERLINFDVQDFNLLYEVLIEIFGKKKVFFFDEIQNIKGWERFVRRMQDEGFKFFITGSNASLLSRELGTKLTGRHVSFTLYPFSFKEFLAYHQYDFKKDNLFITKERALIRGFLENYLKEGGMPEFLAEKNPQILKNVYTDIIYRDVAVRYGINDIKALRELSLYLSTNISGLFSYNSLKKLLGLGSLNTVKSYIEYLENSFLFFTLNIFSYSLKKQTNNPKKSYIIDAGIANFVASRFSRDRGKFFENLVFLELKRQDREIFYYKTKSNFEVDFVVNNRKKPVSLIQVCCDLKGDKTKNREERALLEAMAELNIKEAFIINDNTDEIKTISKKRIKYIPLYKWILLNS